jgi:hypothetical protein
MLRLIGPDIGPIGLDKTSHFPTLKARHQGVISDLRMRLFFQEIPCSYGKDHGEKASGILGAQPLRV